MGNKKKHTVADPTLMKIKEMFQQNLQLANRVQRKNKADIITKFDLTEKLYARRIKAVAHLMPEMKKRYANAYPEIDIVDEFSDIASLPILSYDIIDGESHLCLGAAIWMLDQVWEIHKIQELCDLLPEDCDGVDMPEVYDTRFSYEIIERMLYVIQNRYGETDRCVVPPNILSKRENSAFHDILALIPDEVKETAVEQLKEKFWEWTDLYFKALYPMILKKRKLDRELDRLTGEVQELRERCVKKVSKPTLPLSVPLSLTDYDPVNNPRREAEMLMRRVDKMEKEHIKYINSNVNFR